MTIAHFRPLRWALLPLAALGCAAIAQTDPDAGNGLNIPADVVVFGKNDPALRKPTAVVNGDIITRTDVEQRLALIVAANGGKVPAEELERLRNQVLRNLIDEVLEIQEAKGNKIDITKQQIDDSFARVSRNFKRTPEQMSAYLKQIGSSDESLKRQIEGELAWNRLLQRRVQPFVNVSQEEVQGIVDRLNASKGATEVHLGEIFLSATPETNEAALANARKIIDAIKQGGSFVAYARQFSEASTAAVGGDLGWVRPEQLPDALANEARNMSVGQLAGPIQVPGGYSMIYLMDKRQVLTADPRDAVLALRQLAISFPEGTTQQQATEKATQFANATKTIAGCGSAQKVAEQLGAEMVDNDQVKIRDLPPQLQEMMVNLQVGQASPPFGSAREGVRVLVICGRDDAQAAAGANAETIMAQLEEQRVNMRARRYLRDLRRDAVVDYR
ncbi:peptidylprolyl isomerase [Sphingomonas tabacisoli]|uniref:Parvulin-like PPIase n=1 Tax=Sphingomonas tabacisoli TaxID=2249466 RepID=A0ABW4I2W3_9SPHN